MTADLHARDMFLPCTWSWLGPGSPHSQSILAPPRVLLVATSPQPRTPTCHACQHAPPGADYGAAPDLDHANPELREALKHWLAWLQEDIGFEAWRFDFVKGYAAEFVDEYVGATVGAEALNVGELW